MEARMNLVENLISEVSKRPVLWNRLHDEYNNRSAMDTEWEKIATILKKDKEFVKQKWRNLRDQFQREIKKVKVPFHNPTKPYINYYRGKWIYFQHLLFLRDVGQKKSRNNYSSSEVEIPDDEDFITEKFIVFEDEDNMFAEQIDNYNNEVDFDKEIPVTSASFEDNENALLLQPKVEIIEEDQSEEICRKRKLSETIFDSAVPIKIERPSVVDASSNTEEQYDLDDDLHFVKSLVPYLRKLSPIRKLLVRQEIQSLLIRESICENCTNCKTSPHNS